MAARRASQAHHSRDGVLRLQIHVSNNTTFQYQQQIKFT